MTVRALLCCALSMAAQVGRNKPAGSETATFESTTQLVVQTVVVNDGKGNPVTGLAAKDFVLTEDGTPQDIRFFEYQRLDQSQPVEPLPDSLRVEPMPRLPRSQISPPAAGDTRYRDRRLLALYFDFTAMQLPDQLRALDAARKFVRKQMTAADNVALLTYRSGSVDILQDFTSDRIRLLEILETLIVGEDENAVAAVQADKGAAFGQNDAEFNIFFTDRQLAALQTAATMLGRLNEKKALLYFASGLRLNGANNQAQMTATINAANRAGVSFWPVDARGLVAGAPLGDATMGSPGGLASYSGVNAASVSSSLQRSQDTLWTLAADTGGKAMLDSNDLSRAMVQAQEATSSYYILGYYTTNANPDGKLRRIKITLADGRTAKLDYRQGYYARRVFRSFTSADKERQLEDALMLADPITELTIAMEVGYFQLNRAEYFIPVTIKIPGGELMRGRRRGAERTVIDFVAEIKDAYGTTVTNLRDKVDLKLTGSTETEFATRPVHYETGFTLLPGKYSIKFLARDGGSGRMGTYQMPFVIPNLNREDGRRIATSSVILSSQLVAQNDAIYAVGKQKGQLANPLVVDGKKLVPSVTRVFSRSKDLIAFLQAYQQGDAPTHSLLAYVTFYREGQKVLETKPVEAADAGSDRLKTIPLLIRLPLSSLRNGEYLCQVSIVDAVGGKASFWQWPVMVVP